MAKEYLRWTGDKAWLDKVLYGKTVYETLIKYAEHWRELDTISMAGRLRRRDQSA